MQIAVDGSKIPAAADFQAWIDAALVGGKRAGDVSLKVVGEDESRTLNRRFRGVDAATNVLSFAADLPSGIEARLLGDIAVCAAVVEREAATQGKGAIAHWAHLTVHGTLHLIGYDHQTVAEADAMESLERDILHALGFPDPYSTDERVDATTRREP